MAPGDPRARVVGRGDFVGGFQALGPGSLPGAGVAGQQPPGSAAPLGPLPRVQEEEAAGPARP